VKPTAEVLAATGAFFEIVAPAMWNCPLLLSSPHSGNWLPDELLQLSQLSPQRLRRSEDAYVDELFLGCLELGFPMLRALVSRAYIDLNREPYELDPRMFKDSLPSFVNAATPRVLSGLGTIPRIVAEGEDIYRCKLETTQALVRIETVYRPFHHTLAALLKQAVDATGMVVLLDCHSMPETAIASNHRGNGAVDVVIGDRFGTAAATSLVNELEILMTEAGLRVRRNRPYAGGFITETYGNPKRNQHAIQIEINRALYMNEATLDKTADFTHLQRIVSSVLAGFSEYVDAQAMNRNAQIAAE
jgi:N-formylglutamate amidohydrolase